MLANVIVKLDTIQHAFLSKNIPFILIQEAEIVITTSFSGDHGKRTYIETLWIF